MSVASATKIFAQAQDIHSPSGDTIDGAEMRDVVRALGGGRASKAAIDAARRFDDEQFADNEVTFDAAATGKLRDFFEKNGVKPHQRVADMNDAERVVAMKANLENKATASLPITALPATVEAEARAQWQKWRDDCAKWAGKDLNLGASEVFASKGRKTVLGYAISFAATDQDDEADAWRTVLLTADGRVLDSEEGSNGDDE